MPVAGKHQFELEMLIFFLFQFLVNIEEYLQFLPKCNPLFVVVVQVSGDMLALNYEHILVYALRKRLFQALFEKFLIFDHIVH